MSNSLPWDNKTVEKWLDEIVMGCGLKEGKKKELVDILNSKNDNDSIQFPLYQLLGNKSLDIIETLMRYREKIIDDLKNKNKRKVEEKEKEKVVVDDEKQNVPLSN